MQLSVGVTLQWRLITRTSAGAHALRHDGFVVSFVTPLSLYTQTFDNFALHKLTIKSFYSRGACGFFDDDDDDNDEWICRESVRNSPQTCYRSTEQVGLQTSSERRGGELL